MDRKRIEQLLEKYFEGSTTLEEEARLREYFRREEEIPSGLEAYRSLFQYFEEERALQLSDAFDERLKKQLTGAPLSAARVRRLWPALARIAALVLIALGVWWLYPSPDSPPQQASIDWSKYEPESPEEAYRLTRMALLKVSGELAEGAKTAAREVDKMEKMGRYMK